MSEPQPPPPGIPEEGWSKNRLQQYTQKACMPLPVYQTFCEGTPHAPTFKARVWVDGTCFTSPNSFSTRKMAEQDAAKYALIGIREKVKSEGSSRILQDTVFCKSIINEYAGKMNIKTPTYVTNQSAAMLPVFVSSLVLNGITYIGDAGKNKKEAEQFAARSAILSILESESSTTMSEIVKSKFRFYDALKKVKDSSNAQGNIALTGIDSLKDFNDSSSAQGNVAPTGINSLKDFKDLSSAQGNVAPTGVNSLKDFKDSYTVQGGYVAAPLNPLEDRGEDRGPPYLVNKRKEVHVSGGTATAPSSTVAQSSLLTQIPPTQVELPKSTLEQPSNTQATHQCLHVFKKPKCQTSSVAVDPPIQFVHPATEQALMCSASGKKRNRKNKKAKKKVEHESPLPIVMIPQGTLPACSVANERL